MARQLFGTDGIRGVAGEYPLDAGTVHAFGAALGKWAAGSATDAEVVLGMDTRESGPWLAEQVAGGLARHGVRARFAGLITTPGIAYLTRTRDFVAGVMISASHNPFQDNGLKAFDHSGFKLPDTEEHRIEQEILRLRHDGIEPRGVAAPVDEGLDRAYIDFLKSTFPCRLDGLRMVVDCANGAASHLAPELFEELGAHVYSIGSLPNGRNINLNCGALHVESLRERVLAEEAALGVAFDGDADRAMFVSRSGRIVDGDAVLLIAAGALKAQGRLRGDTVVSTVMSNLGLERALRSAGIRMLRTPVGDKYVLEEMLRQDAVLGGEQSGHVIFREYATTGDGLLTALRVLEISQASGNDLDQLAAGLEVYPQLTVNVRVKHKKPLDKLDAVNREIRAVEAAFGDAGRVLVRFSGTEPLARVMVEGPDPARVKEHAHRIADAIRSELGA
jgi:phosphoglucosamine mutase